MGFFSNSSGRAARGRDDARVYRESAALTRREQKLAMQRSRQAKALAGAQRRGAIAKGRGGAAAGFDRWG
jgi:hypothetical protein